MTPLDVECWTCYARPGSGCVTTTFPQKPARTHQQRTRLAEYLTRHSTPDDTPTEAPEAAHPALAWLRTQEDRYALLTMALGALLVVVGFIWAVVWGTPGNYAPFTAVVLGCLVALGGMLWSARRVPQRW